MSLDAAALKVARDRSGSMLVWFSVTPIGTASGSVSAEVAAALRAVAATGIAHTTEASGTLLEGEWDECMHALRVAGEAVLVHAPRVSFTCKFDLRTDRTGQTGADKMASLRRHLDADGAPDGDV